MRRRNFLRNTGLAGAGMILAPGLLKASPGGDFPVVRVAPADRRFRSAAIEKIITETQAKIADKEIAWLFGNCFPNTLDTTVDFEMKEGLPDTYVITGDIDAMWLRDSTAQVWPYLPFMKDDPRLQQLVKGVLRRQTYFMLLDPYANAFYKDTTKLSEWKDDRTEMKPGIHERKWEIDSLCYPIRLAHGYWKQTGDSTIFDADWLRAMQLVLRTSMEQQRLEGPGPYRFERKTSWATDGVPLGGYGYPAKKTGLIHSMFRPSDDATIYPFLIPSNFFASTSLQQLQEMLKGRTGEGAETSARASSLAAVLKRELARHAQVRHPKFGMVYAYEVNGYGSFNLMDDANVPSLLSMPYLGSIAASDPVYRNTRKLLLSEENPFFFRGTAAEGIGGPHVGMDFIWPMSIIMRAMTSSDDGEIRRCLQWLKSTHAGTGFMHESFHKDDPKRFTRKWFAWANTLFGELILQLAGSKPHLLQTGW